MIANRYSELTIIGKGSSATTYVGFDVKSDQQVAIKVLSLSRLDDWKKAELFEREAEILQQLNYPAIPKYIDYFKIETKDDIDFYIIQELAPGQSLATLINNGWQPDETTVKKIAEQMLDILIYLQTLTPSVIHRDIKPQNIIYQLDTGKLFLVDFGAVQNTYRHTVMGSTVVGTYGYMSPEQFRGSAVLSTDLYSLGCTLLYLLTGKSPAELPQRKFKIDFRSSVKIESNFANWLEKLIEPDIEIRFQNANDALDVLTKNINIKSYKLKQNKKPHYTSIYIVKKKNLSNTLIPPVLLWKQLNFICFIWIFYYAFIILNITIITLVNSWLGYFYGTFVVFNLFSGRYIDILLQIVNILYLLILSIVIVLVRSEWIQIIPLLFVLIDTIALNNVRSKIIKCCFFPTRLSINTNNKFTKRINIERKIFGKWCLEHSFRSEKDIKQAMDINIFSVLLQSNFGYHFGYLLSKKERKWLKKKLTDIFY